MSLFRGKWRKPKEADKTVAAARGEPVPLIVPNCYLNPRTGRFVHRTPHSCAPQARSSFKPRKKRRDYIRKRRKMSRVRP